MSKEIITEVPRAVPAASNADLSRAIEQSVKREPGEEVRSVRVFEDRYRCNWWMRDSTPGPSYLNTGKIIRSKFLKATMRGEKLVVEDVSGV